MFLDLVLGILGAILGVVILYGIGLVVLALISL